MLKKTIEKKIKFIFNIHTICQKLFVTSFHQRFIKDKHLIKQKLQRVCEYNYFGKIHSEIIPHSLKSVSD